MGHGSKGQKTEASGIGREQNPWEWGETLGVVRPLESTKIPTEWEGRRGAARPPEWRKPRGGGATEWEWGSNLLQTTQPATERAGRSNRLRTTRPPTEGSGIRFKARQIDLKWNGRGS